MKKYENPTLEIQIVNLDDDMLLVSFADNGHDIYNFDDEV